MRGLALKPADTLDNRTSRPRCPGKGDYMCISGMLLVSRGVDDCKLEACTYVLVVSLCAYLLRVCVMIIVRVLEHS